MRYLGYIFVGLIIFYLGYLGGQEPTSQEVQQQTAATDLAKVSDSYIQLYNLCEQKYQTAINGDYSSAIRINGQMDTLLAEVNRILNKYNTSAL